VDTTSLPALWAAAWPYITAIVAAASTLDAALPQPAPGSHWLIIRKVISFLAINVGNASNGKQPDFVTWIVRIAEPVLQAQGIAPAPAAKAAEAPASPSAPSAAGPIATAVLVFALGAAGLLGLSACANMQDPTTTIVSVEAGYGAALAAENEYLASGKADPKVVKTLHDARTGVASVLDPIAAAAAKGQAPTSDQALAAQTALSAFQAALQANGLTPKTTNTGSK
jgi:hypothetical protein